MSVMDATATAVTRRTGPWWNRKYEVRLFINDVNTGLHWHVKRREVNKVSLDIVENAAELLSAYGLMDTIFDMVKRGNLPNIGSKVELTVDIGPFTKGTIGTVTSYDEHDEDWPVYVALTADKESAELALALSELKAVA